MGCEYLRIFPLRALMILFFATYTDPPLTTVRQPMRRMGQLAMESLIN